MLIAEERVLSWSPMALGPFVTFSTIPDVEILLRRVSFVMKKHQNVDSSQNALVSDVLSPMTHLPLFYSKDTQPESGQQHKYEGIFWPKQGPPIVINFFKI